MDKTYKLETDNGREWLAIPHAYQCVGFLPHEWYWRIEIHCRACRESIALHMECYEQEPVRRTEEEAIAAARIFLEAMGYSEVSAMEIGRKFLNK